MVLILATCFQYIRVNKVFKLNFICKPNEAQLTTNICFMLLTSYENCGNFFSCADYNLRPFATEWWVHSAISSSIIFEGSVTSVWTGVVFIHDLLHVWNICTILFVAQQAPGPLRISNNIFIKKTLPSYIPGSSRYVKCLPFGRGFWMIFGTNFTHKEEDPGINININIYI